MSNFLSNLKNQLKYILRIPDNKLLNPSIELEYDILYQLAMLFTDLETEDRCYSLQEMTESMKSPDLMLEPKEYIRYAKDRQWLIETENGWQLSKKGSEAIQEFLANAGI